MKRILVWLFIFGFAAAVARAQDDATQQQINKLSGQLQDALEAQALQAKRITDLEKQIGELRDKINQPAQAQDNASSEDLKKLAEQVQEIDKKREADRELILKEIEKLAKISSAPAPARRSSPPVSTTSSDTAATPQKGYEYIVQRNDTLSIIVKAYRDQGVKVTRDQIIKANPGLDPNKLYAGKKIFIPAPAQ